MRIVRDTLWIAGGQVLSALSLLAGIRIITSTAPPQVYGQFSLWLGALALLYTAFCWPALQALLRLYPDVQRQGRLPSLLGAAGSWVTRAALVLVLLIACAGVLDSIAGGGILAEFACFAVLVLIESAKGFVTTVLSATRQQKSFSIFAVADTLLRQAGAVLAVTLFEPTVVMLLLGTLFGAAIALAALLLAARRSLGFVTRGVGGDPELRREIHLFSRPLMPLAISGWVSGVSDRYIVAGIAGSEAAGIYAATYGLISKPFLMIGTTTELVLRQIYYGSISARDTKRERLVMGAWLAVNAVAAALVTCGLWLWGEQLGRLLLGEAFRSGAKLMPWIAGGYGLLLISQALERKAYANKDTAGVLTIQFSGAVASVLCVLPATALFGMPGAAYATPVYFGIQLLVACLVVRRKAAWPGRLPQPSSCLT